ncbi:MAG: FAD-dependent oxidoreductase [Flavobacteriales bacterium]|nr:FAD-dependent oxidoreductase [Flavobacteriales bacterium]
MIQELQLRLSPRDASNPHTIKDAAARKCGIKIKKINAIQVLRRSIDARGRNVMIQIQLVIYTDGDTPASVPPVEYPMVENATPIIIIGSGPAGMFAALKCIEKGYRPIVLERGKDVRSRRVDLKSLSVDHIVNPDSNYCFGEGGAGTYSDGKLYTRSRKRGDVDGVLRRLVECGAQEEIITDARPHIGTNRLPQVVENIRHCITEHGGLYLFGQRVTDFIIKDSRIEGVITSGGEKYTAAAVILATGHSARDIYALLHRKGIMIESKAVALGVRAEHSQDLIDHIQYGKEGRGKYLPAASYKIVEQCAGRGVYSFCMCPGGYIVPSATDECQVVVNGMSPSSRNNRYANSGIVVEIHPEDLPESYHKHGELCMMEYIKDMEYRSWTAGGKSQCAPAARMTDFCEKRASSSLPTTSYTPGITSADMDYVLGDFVAPRLREGFVKFGQKMRGYYTSEACIIGVESRTSSPVRIPRDATTLSHPQISGLFPSGEGAGYAGGIVSAAIDGENCALAAINYISGK